MTALKDVVAFVDGRAGGADILEYALRLSLEHGAHLIGAFVWPPLVSDGPAAYVRGRAIHELFVHAAIYGEEPLRTSPATLPGMACSWRCAGCSPKAAGRLLLSRAASFGADLLVMGAYGHSRFTELVFGGATRTALHEAVLPVLMSR